MTQPPLNALNMAPPRVVVERRPGNELIIRSGYELHEYPRRLVDLLVKWAAETPDRIWLAERKVDSAWKTITFGEALVKVRAVGQALLDRGLCGATPLCILSGNSIDNALLQQAAMMAGIPVAAVSPAYSLLSRDLGKVRYIAALVKPGLIYADDGALFDRSLRLADFGEARRVVSINPPHNLGAEIFESLTATRPAKSLDDTFASVGPDTLAKILFTSGSTGMPKGVINTHRMMCSNQQALAQLWPFLEEKAPVIVDWLPWSHTFGGNHNFNLVLRNGGTLYIDHGKPVPGLIEQSVRNLMELSPTIYFNVPLGFSMILPYLEKDRDLAKVFFRNLDLIFYAGAALPQKLWEHLERLAIRERGERVRMVSAWGSTETAPLVTCVHFGIERAGVIGNPAPGCEVKLTPHGKKLEMRVRGPNVTPAYWKRMDLTVESLDEEGFYKMGDAGKLLNREHPEQGLVFDGRVAEDFKLLSGTWVNVGTVRPAIISHLAPAVQDAVIAGHDRQRVGVLAFASPSGCREVCRAGTDEPLEELIHGEVLRTYIKQRMREYNRRNPGSSTRLDRLLMMTDPPSIDANEITDKGYVNQAAVLERRSKFVEKLFSNDADVIVAD